MAKVLVVGKFYPPCRGGTEANTRDVCEALARRHQVTALVFNHEPGSKEEMRGGVRIVRCDVNAVIKSQPISLQLWRTLDLAGIDLVHFHAPNFFAAALLLFQLRGRHRDLPIIVTHHSDVHARRLIRRFVLPLYHRLARKARWVVVTSLKNAGISADIPQGARIAVVPLGIQAADYAVSDEAQAEADAWRRARYGDAPIVVFIGRHARYKGLDVLVRALAATPGVHALIVGDGPLRQGAEDLAVQFGIQARTHFLGNVGDAEKLRVLACADVFAFPSTEITEAFGISQLEAMAAGVPVIATDLPTGVTDIALHEITALVVPPGDATAFAAALRRLLADGPLRQRLSGRALAHVQTEFSMQANLDKFCDLVDEALQKKCPVSRIEARC
jgi:glycosyltransferase involved in cell wall biosynthesis